MIPDAIVFVTKTEYMLSLGSDEERAKYLMTVWHEGWQQGALDVQEIITESLKKEGE